MQTVDEGYARNAIERLRVLPLDRQPQWGKMSVLQLFGHLTEVLRYAMGEGPDMPYKGTWMTSRVFGPLVLIGLVKIPRNVALPSETGPEPPPVPEGDLDTLESTFAEFIRRGNAGELGARVHPFFGVLSARKWRAFNVVHTHHHLTQFGA